MGQLKSIETVVIRELALRPRAEPPRPEFVEGTRPEPAGDREERDERDEREVDDLMDLLRCGKRRGVLCILASAGGRTSEVSDQRSEVIVDSPHLTSDLRPLTSGPVTVGE